MITCYFENKDKVELRHAVVSVIVTDGNKVLLEKRGTFKGEPILEFGKWALIGGFVDRDETLVETAKRETMEESGWQIDNIWLIRIVDNPKKRHDGERQNISFVFVAKAVSQQSVNSEEVTELKWFNLDKLPPEEKIAFDHYGLLMFYKKLIKENFPVPVLG